MHIEEDGRVFDREHGRQVGYVRDGMVFSGGTGGTMGGQRVGYIQGDIIYAGGSGTNGGRQVGYLRGDTVFSGGHGALSGGQPLGKARYPHPRRHAAAELLLT